MASINKADILKNDSYETTIEKFKKINLIIIKQSVQTHL